MPWLQAGDGSWPAASCRRLWAASPALQNWTIPLALDWNVAAIAAPNPSSYQRCWPPTAGRTSVAKFSKGATALGLDWAWLDDDKPVQCVCPPGGTSSTSRPFRWSSTSSGHGRPAFSGPDKPGVMLFMPELPERDPLTLGVEPASQIAIRQEGVLTHAQALGSFSRSHVRHQLASRRWQRPCRGVVIMHNGPLSASQQAWVALLSAAPGSALGGLTALAFDNFEGFPRQGDKHDVVVPHGASRPKSSLVRPHWSRLLGNDAVHPVRAPRRTRAARSLVDEASWSTNPRRARAVILAGVQQRLARPADLLAVLAARGPIRYRALIMESVLDATGGIQSLPERDYGLLCRRNHMPLPTRQRVLQREDGHYFLDLDWEQYGTACEIHGIPHLAVLQWDSDLLRANEIVIRGPRLLIFSSYAVRHESERVASQTARLLRRGGWSG